MNDSNENEIWYSKTKEYQKQWNSQYYQAHKEHLKSLQKQRYNEKKDQIKQERKKWYAENRHILAANKVRCQYCHSHIRKDCLSRHYSTKKCIKAREANQDSIFIEVDV